MKITSPELLKWFNEKDPDIVIAAILIGFDLMFLIIM
jgi:hypothetical protein